MKRKATPEQIAKAKEKRAKVREIAKKIGAMSEDERRALVGDWPTMIDGHPLSTHNACMIAYQGGGTVIGGFHQWRKAGRIVSSGPGSAKVIWAPKGKRKQSDDSEPTEENARPGFILVSVFDISQTREFNAAIEQDAAETGLPSLDSQSELTEPERTFYSDQPAEREREPAFELANSEPF